MEGRDGGEAMVASSEVGGTELVWKEGTRSACLGRKRGEIGVGEACLLKVQST